MAEKATLQAICADEGSITILSFEFATETGQAVPTLRRQFVADLLNKLMQQAKAEIPALRILGGVVWTLPEFIADAHRADLMVTLHQSQERLRRRVTSQARAGQEVHKCPTCCQVTLLKTERGDACLTEGCFLRLNEV